LSFVKTSEVKISSRLGYLPEAGTKKLAIVALRWKQRLL